MKKTKKILFLTVGLLLLSIFIFKVAQEYYYGKVCNIKTKSGKQEFFYIYPDCSIDSVLNVIREKATILSEKSLKRHLEMLNYKTPKAGYYVINPKEGDIALIRRLRSGSQTPVRFTINRIRTREALAKKVSEQLLIDSIEIITRLESDSFMSRYGLNRQTAVSLFLPNTYEVYWTISPDRLFDRMKREYDRFWNEERLNKADSMGFTPVQIATIASIVEEETNKEFEYPIIARLYMNRLEKGMLLQACPTIKFAHQDFTLRRILNKHLKIDSPYNTYKYRGLPPGPIRSPKATTMDMVLNAPKNDYYYMVADTAFNGCNHFCKTHKEHARYAKLYQAKLNKKKIR